MCPTRSVPDATVVTFSVVPDTVPVKLTAPVPAGQKEPAGHAVPLDAPCAQ